MTRIKAWLCPNLFKPDNDTSYICRMDNGYIKMCHYIDGKWLDVWKSSLEGEVKFYIKIPEYTCFVW